ncbi:M16 family metallopeptidase [Hydrogenophaga sp. PBL-H3]|uniref:M16 family metallopeptidase n=1 Tax=Hydrogenophaga sp. PBL-H3 TaxID=434010 RepID=UPI0013205491|nr:pitrilysin family protein [Hydrogenophaga sp. PBL-H3]QHE75462.1 insulinase family protein [Hydrogenophaga sp. PBL-H3]QHE79888.1 insulinase family protein [Hydrogenophaga sp. PBL-H3]
MKRTPNLPDLRRGALSIALAFTAFGSFAQTPTPASPAPVAQSFTLSNGMTLIVRPDRRAPTVAHMLWVRVGSIDEVDGTSGVAHVLEHMMFKGTPDLKPGEFSRRIAALGGRDNAFTSRDATAYHQQVPAQALEAVMKLEADRFARNQWSDDEFKREIEVVKEERRQRTEESPRARMFEAMNAMVYQASPYRRPIIGWMNDIESMTPADAREFHQRWYTPANAAVVIAGDVDVAQTRALAEKYFGPIAARAVPARKPREEPPQAGPRRMEYRAVADQAVVALAYKVPRWSGAAEQDAASQDALALTVLAAVLDGYAGARLDRALVQGQGTGGKRIADSAGASYGLMGRGPQLFSLSAVPARGVSADMAAAALKSEVQRVAREGISEAELRRVKTQWTAGEVYKLDSVFNQAQELGSYWVNGLDIHTGDRLMGRLRAVTAAQVQSVAQRYFAEEQLTTAVLVPEGNQK